MTPARLKKRSFRRRLSQTLLPVMRPKHPALANCHACPPRISAKETTDLEMTVEDEDTYIREATSMLTGGDWEDIPDEGFDRFLECHSDMEPGRGRTRTAVPRQKRKKKFVVVKEQLRKAIFTTAYHSSNFILGIVLRAARLMCIPLSILLFLLMLPFVMTCISAALRPAFAPICNFPFVSRLPLCVLPTSTITQPAYFPRLTQVESSKFEQLLDGSARRSELFFNLRQAESAPVDLAIIIQHSNLKSNEHLADLVAAFVKDSDKTAERLFMFGSKVAAVEGILSTHEYARRAMQEAEENAPSPYSLRALIFRTGPTTQEVAVEAFTTAMNISKVAFNGLIVEAQISLQNLNTLGGHLYSIREVATREGLFVAAEKSELLARLWTKLGGNRKKLMDCEERLALLKDLGDYRTQALTHVHSAMHTLTLMDADTKDLWDMVATPVDQRLPLHLHLQNIQKGVQRLIWGQMRGE